MDWFLYESSIEMGFDNSFPQKHLSSGSIWFTSNHLLSPIQLIFSFFWIKFTMSEWHVLETPKFTYIYTLVIYTVNWCIRSLDICIFCICSFHFLQIQIVQKISFLRICKCIICINASKVSKNLVSRIFRWYGSYRFRQDLGILTIKFPRWMKLLNDEKFLLQPSKMCFSSVKYTQLITSIIIFSEAVVRRCSSK